jgi:hypothetical protein
MPVASASSASLQIMAMLSAIQQTQSAQLAVATQLEQGFQATVAAINPDLGQIVNLSA